MTVSLCELGPGVVRLLAAASCCPPADFVDAVLAAEDQVLVLVDDRPVMVTGLWEQIFTHLLGDAGSERVVLLHPSYWPTRRCAAVAAIAERTVPTVTLMARSALCDAGSAFVEIGVRHIAVGVPGAALHLESRWADVELVVDRVCRRITRHGGPVSLDAPLGVAGGGELASRIAARLRAAGRQVHLLDERRMMSAIPVPVAPGPQWSGPTPRSRFVAFRTVAAALGGVGAIAALIAVGARDETVAEKTVATTELVDGRMAVRVPAGWPVQRVVDGPGSDRLQVVSPTDPKAILHITQSRVPTDDLDATAQALRGAMATESTDVFGAFNAADQRAGRSAVTYRETRPGHIVDWTIVVDNGVRISIGCQRPPDGAARVAEACDQAIGSAHGIR